MSPVLSLEGKPKFATTEVLSCTDNRSVSGNPSTSMDNGSVLKNPLTSNDSSSVSENPSVCKDNGCIVGNPSACKDNGSILDSPLNRNDNISILGSPLACKDSGCILEIPLTSKDNESIWGNPSVCKDSGSVLESPLASKDYENVLELPLASKDNESVLELPSASKDNQSVLESPLTSKENGTVLENHTASKDNGSALKNPLTSKDIESVLEQPLASKDNGSVLEIPLASKDNGNVFENSLTSNDNGSVLEIPLTSKNNGNVLENPLISKVAGSALEQPLASKDNGSVPENLNVLANVEDKFLRCANNHEDDTFHMEALLGEQCRELNKNEDADVDIMECVKSVATGLFDANNYGTTESSSSFGNSVSEHENLSSFSDVEVNSRFFSCNTSASAFGGCGEAFPMRKKKLTDHWKRFIHPIKWRCRWIELRVKELNSQASRYERELAQYDQRKQFEFELEKHTLEEIGAKSLPFCSQVQRMKVMKRKKRKRVEDTIDVASHMSHHNLFSYFENKRTFSDGMCMDDNGSNPVIPTDKTKNGNDEFGVNEECLTLQFKDGDDSLEQILWKIDAMQSQVQKLRTRADKVVSEIPIKFSSINLLNLLVPCDTLTSSQDPVSPTYNGMPIRCINECDMGEGDLIMPDSGVLSLGEATPFLNMIESTDQPQVGDSYKNTKQNLINNLAEEGLLDFEKARIQPIVIEEPHVPGEKKAHTVSSTLIPEADRPIKTSVPRVQSTVKSVTTPKANAPNNKGKRGKRKAGSRKWSKRSSG